MLNTIKASLYGLVRWWLSLEEVLIDGYAVGLCCAAVAAAGEMKIIFFRSLLLIKRCKFINTQFAIKTTLNLG